MSIDRAVQLPLACQRIAEATNHLILDSRPSVKNSFMQLFLKYRPFIFPGKEEVGCKQQAKGDYQSQQG